MIDFEKEVKVLYPVYQSTIDGKVALQWRCWADSNRRINQGIPVIRQINSRNSGI